MSIISTRRKKISSHHIPSSATSTNHQMNPSPQGCKCQVPISQNKTNKKAKKKEKKKKTPNEMQPHG
jgi:hypothetical protein